MKKEFLPAWYNDAAPEGSFRALYAPKGAQAPKAGDFAFIKRVLHLSNEDFAEGQWGEDRVTVAEVPFPKTFSALEGMVCNNAFDRVAQTMDDHASTRLSLSRGERAAAPILLRPTSAEEVQKIAKVAKEAGATLGAPHYLYLRKGEESLALEFSSVSSLLSFNEIDRTLQADVGACFDDIEEYLHSAPANGAHRNYTLGYKAKGCVLHALLDENEQALLAKKAVWVEYVTAQGERVFGDANVKEHVRAGELPLTVLFRVSYVLPQKTFAYLFKDYRTAVTAARSLVQSGVNLYSLTIADENATQNIVCRYGVKNLVTDAYFTLRGRKNGCLVLGSFAAPRALGRSLRKFVRTSLSRYGAVTLTRFFADAVFKKAYDRSRCYEAYGILCESVTQKVSWENLPAQKEGAEKVAAQRKHTYVLTESVPYNTEGVLFTSHYLAKASEENVEFLRSLYE